MGVLFAKQRNALPKADFAGPDRSFPIPDASHARNALARAHFAANPAAIKAKVAAKFPSIQVSGMKPRAAALVGKLKG